ncbi:MAG: hypothetical protein AMXMBFR56_54500 [Polyangiaceae bacterium]
MRRRTFRECRSAAGRAQNDAVGLAKIRSRSAKVSGVRTPARTGAGRPAGGKCGEALTGVIGEKSNPARHHAVGLAKTRSRCAKVTSARTPARTGAGRPAGGTCGDALTGVIGEKSNPARHHAVGLAKTRSRSAKVSGVRTPARTGANCLAGGTCGEASTGVIGERNQSSLGSPSRMDENKC